MAGWHVLLWLAACFNQFHVGILGCLVGKDPGVELAPLLRSAFCYIGTHIFQAIIAWVLRTVEPCFLCPGWEVDGNLVVELVL